MYYLFSFIKPAVMIWILFAIAVILVAVFIIPSKKETVRASSEVKQKEILSPDALALKERLGLDMSGLNRPITISLTKNMLLSSPDVILSELQNILDRTKEFTDVYTICEALNDPEQSQFLSIINRVVPTLAQHRCLFYETSIGKTAIIRQVNPSIHIDSDKLFCDKLRPHHRKIVYWNSEQADGGDLGDAASLQSSGAHPASEDGACGTNSEQPPRREILGTGGYPTIQSLQQFLNLRLSL